MIVDWNGIVCALLFTLLFQAIRSFYVSFIARKVSIRNAGKICHLTPSS